MSHRCINAFEFAGTIYPGGSQVDDDHPILATHASYFAPVQGTDRPGTETATAAPGERRAPQPAAADVEAWLAAEKQYEEDVQAWLLAEEEHQGATTAAASSAGDDADKKAETHESQAAPRAAGRRQRPQEGKN